jgi:hypothetical protein
MTTRVQLPRTRQQGIGIIHRPILAQARTPEKPA